MANPNWKKGISGNPHGRPVSPEREELRLAMLEAKKLHGDKSFLVHFCERAYVSDAVAIALAKKLLPDKLEGELGSNTLDLVREALNAIDGKTKGLPESVKA